MKSRLNQSTYSAYFFILTSLILLSPCSTSSKTIRFTTNGYQCHFPVNYNNIIYNNCIIDQVTTKEWCYIDSTQIIKYECANSNFQISSQLWIQSPWTRSCLYLSSVDWKLMFMSCNSLFNSDSQINFYKFYWYNHTQIKVSQPNLNTNYCLVSVDMPIIINGVWEYFGYVSQEECGLSWNQKWSWNENGMIINEGNKKCLVIGKESLNPRENGVVYLGECIGNIKGYKGNEIFILIKDNEYLKELYALEKIIQVYNQEYTVLKRIDVQHNEAMNNVIQWNTQILECKDKMDDVEKELQREIRKYQMFDDASGTKHWETQIERQGVEWGRNKGDVNGDDDDDHDDFIWKEGVTVKITERNSQNNNNDNVLFAREVKVENGKIKMLNVFDLFRNSNWNSQDIKPEELWENDVSGFDFVEFNAVIYWEERDSSLIEGKFQVETNLNFLFEFNNKIIFKKLGIPHDIPKSKGNGDLGRVVYSSEWLRLSPRSWYPIKIIVTTWTVDSVFKIKFIPSSSLPPVRHGFLPQYPTIESYQIPVNTLYKDYLKEWTCDSTFRNVASNQTLSQLSKYKYICTSSCASHPDSICNQSFSLGKLPPSGGVIGWIPDNNLTTLSIKRYGITGWYLLITDIKLGYYRDYIKNSELSNTKLFNGYISKQSHAPKYSINEDASFILYKQGYIADRNATIITNVLLQCDNTIPTNINFIPSENTNTSKNILHDIINEFTWITERIRFQEWISKPIAQQVYVTDINVRILSLREAENSENAIRQEQSNEGNQWTIKTCRANHDKIIILELKHGSSAYTDTVDTVDTVDDNASGASIPRIVNYNKNYKMHLTTNANENEVKSFRRDTLLIRAKTGDTRVSSFIEISGDINESDRESDNATKEIPEENKWKNHKVYSKDFWSKIEETFWKITNKLKSNGDIIHEIENKNQILSDKITKILPSRGISSNSRGVNINSISLWYSQWSQINKLIAYLNKVISAKIVSTSNKNQQIKDAISESTNKNNGKEFLGNSFFFNRFAIIDSSFSNLFSSLWDIRSSYGNSDHSVQWDHNQLITAETGEIPSKIVTIIRHSLRNLHVEIVFKTEQRGEFVFIPRYSSESDYLYLEFSNNNSDGDQGTIRMHRLQGNKTQVLNELKCKELIQVFGACQGYSFVSSNKIEMFCNEDQECEVWLNDNHLIGIGKPLSDQGYQIGFGVNNIGNISVNHITIENVLHNRIVQLDHNIRAGDIPENGSEITNAREAENKLVYNKNTNSFSVISVKTRGKENKNNTSPLGKHATHELISRMTSKEETSKIYDRTYFLKQCNKHSDSQSICIYLDTFLTENNINLSSITLTTQAIVDKIKQSCLVKLSSIELCEQIVTRVSPVVDKWRKEMELPLRVIDLNNQFEHSNSPGHVKKDTNLNSLISTCGFDFLPKWLKNKKICLNQMMLKEIEKNDNCRGEYCRNCCEENYENDNCGQWCKRE